MQETNKIVYTSLFFSLVLFIGLTPLGYINIGVISITILPALVIFITCLFGMYYGIVSGIAFGISSLIQSIIYPSLFTPFFLNPMISILPRLLFPIFSYYIFNFLMFSLFNKNSNKIWISSLLTGIIGTSIHSFLTISSIWLFRGFYISVINSKDLFDILSGLIATNVLVEIAISCILLTFLVPVLYKITNKKNY